MKRFALAAFVAIYAICGMALLIQMTFCGPPPAGWNIQSGEGDLVWNGWTKRMKVVVRSERMILETPEADLGRFEIVRQVPGATVYLKVTGENPSRIHEKLSADGSLFLINPHGIIVGPGAIVDVGGLSVLSTLDLERDFENEVIDFSSVPVGGDLESSTAELITQGNVYALAIKTDGKIRASGIRTKERVVLTTDK